MNVKQVHEGDTGPPQDAHALLRKRQVLKLLQVSRATFQRWLRDGTFPRALKLPGGISAWRAATVYAWIDHLEQAADSEDA
jgi:predicted DNA-binding transcriptional regulator AlpA